MELTSLLVVSLLLLSTRCLAKVHLENGADLPAGGLSAPPLHQLSGKGTSREFAAGVNHTGGKFG